MRRWFFLWSVVILLAGVTLGPVLAKDILPRFEPAECPFELSGEDLRALRVQCGYVVVPENRADPYGSTIRLAVAVYHSSARDPQPDPLIYLDGGPGVSTLVNAEWGLVYTLVLPHLEQRDVILFDQRGVGFSEPNLECPELDTLYLELAGRVYDPTIDTPLLLDTATACHNRLSAAGIDLTAYNTTENAADVNDIRLALGYEQLNLYGVSYGTLLAQYTMRQYPDAVRSVVLDSVVPVDINLIEEHPANTYRVFKLLFSACAADHACSRAYPDLETTFFDLVKDLNEAPQVFHNVRGSGGRRYEVVIDGNVLIRWLYGALYSTDAIPMLPGLIYELRNGGRDVLEHLAVGTVSGGSSGFSYGMYLSVLCEDVAPANNPEMLAQAIERLDHPEMRQYYTSISPLTIPGLLTGCERWGTAAAAPEAAAPVASDIPTLVLTGEYDPITPPHWGQRVARRLTTSYVYLFPGYGHGVTGDGYCALGMMQNFLANPAAAPDATCMQHLHGVDFWLP